MSARIASWIILACSAGAAPGWDDDLSLRETESIEHTFPAAKTVDVDNFDGSITVTGVDARDIRVEIRKTIRARSQEKMEEAKREVSLDMTPHDEELRMYVDGPFRCKCGDGSINYRGSRFYGYEVSFDFTVKLPRETSLRLRTVNR